MARLSRRAFGISLTAAAFSTEASFAQLSMLGGEPGPGSVLINANENPLGPCPEALEAMASALKTGGRYHFMEGVKLARALAESEGLPADHVTAFAGSSDPLFRAVYAFTSSSRAFVTADPGYEAGMDAAETAGARVVRVPLTRTHAHDVRAMAAVKDAGLIYICNPNNPTGTVTPRADIDWLLANKQPGCVLLIDEAYIHLSSSAAPCVDLVRSGKDVIVLRTFSKLYGMAGIRAGAALTRPDLMSKLRRFGAGMLPTAAMIGARVSLGVRNLVAERRKLVADAREETFSFLERGRYSFIPSDSNCFMIDVKRPGREMIQAMARESVYIGRVWPSWPTHVRITVGTREEMAKFRAAFTKVMA